MVEEGARVRLRPDCTVVRGHPELRDMIGVVGSIMRGKSWQALGTSPTERARDVSMHLRFAELNLVCMNVPAEDVEPVDRLSPELRVV